jgi:catechol 2,3-dioxygenase-like lactoylglutathione lyase family enzyme
MIRIDHVGIPAHARLDAASYLARIVGLAPEVTDDGRVATARVSSGFTLDFFDALRIEPMHIAFVADAPAFDHTLAHLQAEGIADGSEPHDPANGRAGHPVADRGLYFRTPDGHLLEVMSSASEPGAA